MKSIIQEHKYLIIDIVFLLMYSFIFVYIPEFVSFGSELGAFLNQLALAFFAGYIFYILIEFIPKKRQKVHVYSYVQKKGEKIKSNLYTLIDNLMKEVKKIQEFTPDTSQKAVRQFKAKEIDIDSLDINNMTKEDIKRIMGVINDLEPSPYSRYEDLLNPMSWNEHFRINTQNSLSEVGDILTVIPYLDVEHIVILTEIQESEFPKLVKNIIACKMAPDCEIFGDALFDYYIAIQEIENLKC